MTLCLRSSNDFGDPVGRMRHPLSGMSQLCCITYAEVNNDVGLSFLPPITYGVNSTRNPRTVPAKAGIYSALDSPVSSTGQAKSAPEWQDIKTDLLQLQK